MTDLVPESPGPGSGEPAGQIEIDFAPADVAMNTDEGLPRLAPIQRLESLTDEQVRAVLEETRRRTLQ